MNKAALKTLGNYMGTEAYHRLSPFTMRLTDGTLALATHADAFWLMGEIAMAQMVSRVKNDPALQQIQFWTLTKDGSGAILKCERDEGDVAYTQKIPYTDFPFDVLPNPRVWVKPASYDGVTGFPLAMLPSEN